MLVFSEWQVLFIEFVVEIILLTATFLAQSLAGGRWCAWPSCTREYVSVEYCYVCICYMWIYVLVMYEWRCSRQAVCATHSDISSVYSWWFLNVLTRAAIVKGCSTAHAHRKSHRGGHKANCHEKSQNERNGDLNRFLFYEFILSDITWFFFFIIILN